MKWLHAMVLLLLLVGAQAQKQGNIWYFGANAGLDFSSGAPVSIGDGQTYEVGCPACHSEGTAVMSDSAGALLFYTNGERIWNRAHEIMPNGVNLLSTASATQSSLILPMPGSDHLYYVFTVDDFYFHNLQYGFRYSVVDMCLDGGMGDVVPTHQNVLLMDTVAEKLTAVRHANGIDYWVLVHKYYSNAFLAYQVTGTGLSTPVVSNIGSIHPIGITITDGAIGQMKASPNGEKLVVVNGNTNFNVAEYFDFDANTGVVSSPVSIQFNPMWHYYGASFSPDNSKLYISCSLNGNNILQFDMNAGGGHPDSVVASVYGVAAGFNYLAMQLAVDGKIYVTRAPYSGYPYLGVINNPNAAGAGCGFVDSAIDLDGHSASYGLPNFVDSYDYSNRLNDCAIGIADYSKDREFEIVPNPLIEVAVLRSNRYLTGAQLKVFDATGKLVLAQAGITGNEFVISRDQLAVGIYAVHLSETGRSTIVQKLVVAG